MRTYIYFLLLLSFFLARSGLMAQQHHLSIGGQYHQIKDAFNYGYVFHGPGLDIAYRFEKVWGKQHLQYQGSLSFGLNFKKGMGLNLGFSPIDLFYGYQLSKSESRLVLGAYISDTYSWQLYPSLQSGHLFWFTSIELGPKIDWTVAIKKHRLRFQLANSLIGFSSRPEAGTEVYFYDRSLHHFIAFAHRQLHFGSFNQFNRTVFDLEWQRETNKRFYIGYSFEYYGYYKNPKLSYLSHALRLRCKIGKL